MLGIPEVIVPPYPGITSAMGLLTTDLKYDAVRTEFQVSGAVDLEKLNAEPRRHAGGPRGAVRGGSTFPLSEVTFARAGDLRYVGQGYELRVPLPDGEITDALPQVWTAFHAAHAAEYGHAFEASPIEIVNVRVSGVGRVPKLRALERAEGRLARKGEGRARAPACSGSAASSKASTRPSTSAAAAGRTSLSPVPPSSCRPTAPRSFRPARPRASTRPATSSSRWEARNDRSFRVAARSPARDPRRSGHRRGHPRRAGEHRDRDGPQADAHELFLHHPRVRGFRRRAHRRRGAASSASAR